MKPPAVTPATTATGIIPRRCARRPADGTTRPQRRVRAAGVGQICRQHQRIGGEGAGHVRPRAVDPRHRRDAGRAVWGRHLGDDHQHHHREVWPLVGRRRPLGAFTPSSTDAILQAAAGGPRGHTAVYNVLGVDMEGHRDILGHWLGDGGEGANFWLSVLTDLQNRGVADIFLACIDGLNGFSEAIRAVFPQTQVQRCVIHQIRSSLKYVSWTDHKAFVADLKRVYRAATRDEAQLRNRPALGDKVPHGHSFLADQLAGGLDLLRLSG